MINIIDRLHPLIGDTDKLEVIMHPSVRPESTRLMVVAQIKCKRCGKSYYPKGDKMPKFCAKCHSPYYMKERQK